MTGRFAIASATTTTLAARLEVARPAIGLLPVGSVEPHGPHLALATDTLISEAAIELAAQRLHEEGLEPMILPAVAYGVTDFARGFAGAIGVRPAALIAYLQSLLEGCFDNRFVHVCIVNNHLEPEHDAAVRKAAEPFGQRVSVACPLTRRWARTLTPEFKSGACHAGQYETSIVLAARPAWVDRDRMRTLPDVPISLSQGIADGKKGFAEMGMERAYAGTPAAATQAEGEQSLQRLSEMIVREVLERVAPTSARAEGS